MAYSTLTHCFLHVYELPYTKVGVNLYPDQLDNLVELAGHDLH